MKKVAFTISALGLVALSCRINKPASTSVTKEFAATTSASNFAVIAGYNADQNSQAGIRSDSYNWKNVLERANMGAATVAYDSTSASVAEVRAAFQKVGAALQTSSTVTFAFTGQRTGGALQFRDGSATVESLINDMKTAAKVSLGTVRFYALTDTATVGAISDSFVDLSALGVFAYAVDVSSRSGSAYGTTGRLASEFAGALWQLAPGNNPKLGDFLGSVAARIKAAGGTTTVRESNQGLGIMNQPMLSVLAFGQQAQTSTFALAAPGFVQPAPYIRELPVRFPSNPAFIPQQQQAYSPFIYPQGPQFPQAQFPQAVQYPPMGQLQLPGVGGIQGSNGGQTDVTQYSLSYCQPCKEEASRIASMEAFRSGQCSYEIVIVDQDNPNALSDWSGTVGGDSWVTSHSHLGSDPNNSGSYPQMTQRGSNPACKVQ